MNAGAWVARRRRTPFEPVGNRKDSAPRFSRFAAAMQAAPPPAAQVLPDQAAPAASMPLGLSKPIVVEPSPVDAAAPAPAEPTKVPPEPLVLASGPKVVPQEVVPEEMVPQEVVPEWLEPEPVRATAAMADAEIAPPPVIPRRPVVDDREGSRIPWLGLGSWLLLCGALFASLIGWPSQASFDRVSQLWSTGFLSMESATQAEQDAPTPVQSAALPQDEPEWTPLPETAGDLQTLPPTDVAPPIRPATERTVQRIPGGPPLPQFKPIVEGVAAKFSNAFFEIGDRLQKEGNADAAIHMRRQGSKLDPWRPSTGSEL